MIGVSGAVVVVLMATDTGGWCTCISVSMTLGTSYGGVGSGKREVGFVVVEGSRLPGGFGVAGLAVGAETGSLVIGIGGAVEVVLVATDTSGRGVRVPVNMALGAGYGGVGSAKREVGFIMVEGSWLPGGCIVTGLAV